MWTYLPLITDEELDFQFLNSFFDDFKLGFTNEFFVVEPNFLLLEVSNVFWGDFIYLESFSAREHLTRGVLASSLDLKIYMWV